MKALKSIVLLTTGVLALSACDMKKKEQVSGSTTQDTTYQEAPYQDATMGAGTAATPAAAATNMNTSPAPKAVETTSQGSGAVSDDMASEDLSDQNYDEDYSESDEAYLPSTSVGTGKSSDDYEYVDETSSEPNNVRGGRDPRMVPKNNEIDNTSSEPDADQE